MRLTNAKGNRRASGLGLVTYELLRPFDGLSAGKVREMEWTVVHH